MVEQSDPENPGSFKKLFQVVNVVDDSLTYDYSAIIKGLRLMFPQEHVFITFKVG